MNKVLYTVNKVMQDNRLPYQYMEWKDKLTYPYIIGEYTEKSNLAEDGRKTYEFTLTVTGKSTWRELESIREKIGAIFPSVGGYTAIVEGSAVAIFYDGSFPIETGTEEYKRIQINLYVMEWGN